MPLVAYLYPNSGNRPKRVEILGSAFGKSLPKQWKSAEKGRDSQVPQVAYLYPNSGNQPKRVEIPRATVRISLPKQRKSVEKVEIPRAIARISLPKQWKSAEKGRDSQVPPAGYLYPNSKNRPTFVFPYSNILQVIRVYDKIHTLN